MIGCMLECEYVCVYIEGEMENYFRELALAIVGVSAVGRAEIWVLMLPPKLLNP